MRKTVLFFTLLLAMCATAQTVETNISGSVGGTIQEVSIAPLYGDDNPFAKAVVRDHKFTCHLDRPKNELLKMFADKGYFLPFINDGTPITVTVNEENGQVSGITMVSGSEQNMSLAALDSEFDELDMAYNSAYNTLLDGLTEENRNQRVMQLSNIYDSVQVKKIERLRAYKNTMIPLVYLPNLITAVDYELLGEFMAPETSYFSHPMMVDLRRVYDAIGKRQVGRQYTDVALADQYGRKHQLSEWCGKGNFVFIDFWASWCAPCREEMPNVVTAYSRYHGKKNFEIIGISLDNKESAWKNGIKQLGMTWPQLSDLGGWKSEAAKAYGIMSIPSNVLLNPEGKIIATDLRGEELQQVLADLFE